MLIGWVGVVLLLLLLLEGDKMWNQMKKKKRKKIKKGEGRDWYLNEGIGGFFWLG